MKSESIEGLVQAIEKAIRAGEEDCKPRRGRVIAFKKTSGGELTGT